VFYNSSNQVTFASNVAPLGYAYDQAGNVLSDNINQYLYDAEGRICAVAKYLFLLRDLACWQLMTGRGGNGVVTRSSYAIWSEARS
jgi:hypothetical protein